jgi:hypothetical protein
MSDDESFIVLGSTPTPSMDQFSYGSTGLASVEERMQSTKINCTPSAPSSFEKENVMEISAQTEANYTLLNSSQQFTQSQAQTTPSLIATSVNGAVCINGSASEDSVANRLPGEDSRDEIMKVFTTKASFYLLSSFLIPIHFTDKRIRSVSQHFFS